MRLSLAVAMALLAACSKKEPPPPEPTEPWPAHAAPSAKQSPTKRTTYQVEERASARVRLKTRALTARGELRVARGQLEINLNHLARSKGTIAMDVASIAMTEAGDAGLRDATNAARSWLNVGSNRPEAERERVRWASFEITRIEDVTSDTAAGGRKVKVPIVRDAGADASDSGDGQITATESRRVRLKAFGTLTFNGYRVEKRVSLEVVFHWQGDADLRSPPARVNIRTRRPFVLELAAHDIAPRDESGRRTPGDDKLLGRRVSREARIELELSAKLASK